MDEKSGKPVFSNWEHKNGNFLKFILFKKTFGKKSHSADSADEAALSSQMVVCWPKLLFKVKGYTLIN